MAKKAKAKSSTRAFRNRVGRYMKKAQNTIAGLLYFFMAIVVLMLQPVIFIDNATKVLGALQPL